jgi:hypothetical protein
MTCLLSCAAQGQPARFTLQVQADPEEAVAAALAARLRGRGLDAYYVRASVPGKGVFYRVRIGRFATESQARALAEELRRSGLAVAHFVAKYERAPEESLPGEFLKKGWAVTSPFATRGRWAASVRPNLLTSTRPPQRQAASSDRSWEFFLAGGASLWSSQDGSLGLSDVLGSAFPAQPKIRLRQSFVTGGRFTAGLVKNMGGRSALELAYGYGTNNFRVRALENGNVIGVPEIERGDAVSLGMRSHTVTYNYRYAFFNGEITKAYVTFGGNVVAFRPNNDELDRALRTVAPADNPFRRNPRFRTVVMPGANFGAGFITQLSDRVGVRVDVRDMMTFTKRVKADAELKSGEKFELELFGGTVHNLVPSLGVVFKF